MAAARLPPPQVLRRHLVRLLRRARQLKPVRLLRLLYPGSVRCHRSQGEDPSLFGGYPFLTRQVCQSLFG